jgi:release factor glutamine methyltransferase
MDREAALVALGCALRERRYAFVTVTPGTHARVLARGPARASSLRDVFGWSRPFTKDALPAALFDLLDEAGALVASATDDTYRSAVRFSTLAGDLFAHSAYPTADAEAVFFGPDTYRFCAAIARAGRSGARVVDIGCGSGAGGVVAGRRAERLVLADVNDEALAFARVNAALAGIAGVEVVRSDVLAQVEGAFDLVVANPPYMRDEARRVYRDGGGAYGEQLSIRIAREAAARLAPGGTLLLYTGAAVVDGEDVFLEAVATALGGARNETRNETRSGAGLAFDYEELDPDVFGDELERPGYERVERIAAVLLTVTRPPG